MKANSLKIQITCILFALVLALTAFGQAPQAAPAAFQDHPDGPWYRPNEVLIKFKAKATEEELADAVRVAGIKGVRQIQTAVMKAKGDHGITRAAIGMPVAQAVQALKNHPAVEYAEPNWVYQHQATANDTYFTSGQLWGMYGNASTPANQYGSQAAEAWAAGYIGDKSVVVGVIDEGMQVLHPDLSANIWRNPGEIADDGIDNDDNGLVDDVNGWDFVQNNNSVYDGTGDDHGTHVAGTIGAIGNNAGVVGVNWNVSIISGKFLGPVNGTTADAIEAIDYFITLKKRGVNIVALNNSWGGAGYSQTLHDAIIRAAKAGILFVAAAGNGNRVGKGINIDTTPFYPACYNTAVGTLTEDAANYDAVISVTAIDSTGKLASFANYGVNSVDLAAPGVNVLSTVPEGMYASYSGTSMATPHVTGAIALYASTHPDAKPWEIKAAILGSVLLTPSVATKTSTGGRLDLSTIITPSGPPEPPASLAAAAGDGKVTLTWSAAANASKYNVKRSGTSGGSYETIAADVTTTSYVDAGVNNDITYYYVVSAVNTAGESADSTEVSATPVQPTTPPTAPSGLTAVASSQSHVYLTWTDNSSDELGFRIIRQLGEEQPVTIEVAENATSFTDSGLSPNTAYNYSILASNAAGESAVIGPGTVTTLPTPTATFVKVDTTTKGTWKNVYGSQGYHIYRMKNGGPYIDGLGANVGVIGAYKNTWLDPTSDPRALQAPGTGDFSRFADCYFTGEPGTYFLLDVLLPTKKRLSLYCLDWDSTARRQTIQILDATDLSVVLHEQKIDSSFNGGLYLTWDIEGRVKIKVIYGTGYNAVVSGIFFDEPVDTPPPPTGTMHCSLAGTAAKVNANWNATATVTVLDANHEGLHGATVTGTWSGGYSGAVTGTTGADGAVSFKTGTIPKNKANATFTITGVTLQGYTYDSSANHDGTSITIPKPQ